MTVTRTPQQELNQLIRDVVASADADATPLGLAEAVVEKAGEDLLSAVVIDLVADQVQCVLRADRRAALNRRPGGPRPGSVSPKLERRRDWWARTLDTRVCVGEGTWRRLGDCTVEDLQYCISERETLIGQVRNQIDNYAAIIAAMRKYKVRRVSDLTAEQVKL